MFTNEDFEVFQINGLNERMQAIRKLIQPKFQQLDTYFVEQLANEVGKILPIHIAQHRRRSVYAPDFTWSAMGGDSRGYKKYPHFQLGINEEYLVMWLSLIDNPKNKQFIATEFLNQITMFNQLSSDFVVNTDHTKNNYLLYDSVTLNKALVRFKDVKKGEFQIGRILLKEDKRLQDVEWTKAYMLQTYKQLIPFYKLAINVQQANKTAG